MYAENQTAEEIEIEGHLVTVCCYRLGAVYVTSVESGDSGCVIASAIAKDPERSRQEAFEAASQRLLQRYHCYLTVGG